MFMANKKTKKKSQQGSNKAAAKPAGQEDR